MTGRHSGYSLESDFSHENALLVLHAVQKKYGALISAARKDWECRFAGGDPADGCISVRISTAQSDEEIMRVFTLELDRTRQPAATS